MLQSKLKIDTGSPFTTWTKKDSKTVLKEMRRIILRRIGAGKDVSGSPFVPYDQDYATEKGSTKVDLRDTGKMLDSLGIKIQKDMDGSVFVQPKYSVYVDKKRSFMGLSRGEVDKILELVADLFDNHIKDANKGGSSRIGIGGA